VPPPDDAPPPATPTDPGQPAPDASKPAPVDQREELPYTPPRPKDIVIDSDGQRTTKNIVMVSGILVGGLALGGLGLHYNLDARDAADKVSASVVRDPNVDGGTLPSGKTWNADDQKLVDRASSSSTKAEILYAVGGAAVIGAIVLFIVTDPPATHTVIHTTRPERKYTVAPTNGGAMLGAVGTF
jgi:hypothetical protein